jgi:hypothetical protein
VSPRVREDSVHPRLQSGTPGRPLNFTVRRLSMRGTCAVHGSIRTIQVCEHLKLALKAGTTLPRFQEVRDHVYFLEELIFLWQVCEACINEFQLRSDFCSSDWLEPDWPKLRIQCPRCFESRVNGSA